MKCEISYLSYTFEYSIQSIFHWEETFMPTSAYILGLFHVIILNMQLPESIAHISKGIVLSLILFSLNYISEKAILLKIAIFKSSIGQIFFK